MKKASNDPTPEKQEFRLPENNEARQSCPIDSLQDVFEPSNGIVARMDKGCPTVDFAGPGRVVYQVTVGQSHSFNQSGVLKILCAAGLVQETKHNINKKEVT